MSDESDIRSLLRIMHSYFETGDKRFLMQIISKQIDGFGTNVDEIHLDWESWNQLFDRQANQLTNENIKPKMNLVQQKINFLDNKNAYTMGYGNILLHYPNGDFNFGIRETIIFNKENEEWKVRHVHLSFPFIGSQDASPFPKIESLSDNISNWLKSLEIDTTSWLSKNKNQKAELIKYLKKAKAILVAENDG